MKVNKKFKKHLAESIAELIKVYEAIETDDTNKDINEAAFNFDQYEKVKGEIIGDSLIKFIEDTVPYGSMENPVRIYDRTSGKYMKIVDGTIAKNNSGIILDAVFIN